jgi:hypothetical protein
MEPTYGGLESASLARSPSNDGGRIDTSDHADRAGQIATHGGIRVECGSLHRRVLGSRSKRHEFA